MTFLNSMIKIIAKTYLIKDGLIDFAGVNSAAATSELAKK